MTLTLTLNMTMKMLMLLIIQLRNKIKSHFTSNNRTHTHTCEFFKFTFISCVIHMERSHLWCAPCYITLRCARTVRPNFLNLVSKDAQNFKEESPKGTGRKKKFLRKYRGKCTGGGGIRPPPGPFRVK